MKKKSLLIILLIVIAVLLTTSGSYAFYRYVRGTGPSSATIGAANGLTLEFQDGEFINAENFVPGFSVTKNFSVANENDRATTFNVYLNDVLNTITRTTDLTYGLYDSNDILISTGVFPKDNAMIANKVTIPANTTKEYYLLITYANSEEDQSVDIGFIFTGKVSLVPAESLKNTITMTVADGVESELRGIFGNIFSRKDKVDKVTINGTDVTNDYLNNNYKIEYGTGDVIKVHFSESLTDLYYMFYETTYSTIDLQMLDTSNVTRMSFMFDSCSSLTNLDVSNFDTSNVTSMSWMFYKCINLTNLDVSNFDTSKVTNMSSMFENCSNLASLDVSNFDTHNVIDMSSMFENCSSLTSLDVSNFDTHNVIDMSSMFENCSSLTSLDVSNFDTSNVTKMYSMFSECEGLLSLDLSNFDTSNVTDMYAMFEDCSSLTNLDVSNFDTSNVTDMSAMFLDCNSLTNLDVSNFDTRNVTDMSAMFSGCSNLTNLDVSNFDTTSLNKITFFISLNYGLQKLNLGNFNIVGKINEQYISMSFVGMPSTLKIIYNSNYLVDSRIDLSSFQTCDLATNTCEGFLD